MTNSTPQAVVNFRTLANGSFKYIKPGQRRGYWRVLLLADPNGSTKVNSKNVLEVLYSGPEGIDGVTDRSCYCIDGSLARAQEIAAKHNA